MATASISITNNMGGTARIVLFHKNSRTGMRRRQWVAADGETVGSLEARFTSGSQDHWSAMALVADGPSAGLYFSSGVSSGWTRRDLQPSDDGASFTLAVNPQTFGITLSSHPLHPAMNKVAPKASKPISHVFVVMLENHSFDNMLAFSGIAGITAATGKDLNEYKGIAYWVRPGAPPRLTTDPGHEFDDVVTQLCNRGVAFTRGKPYPQIVNGGFARSYATSTTEEPYKPPAFQHIGDIMECFETPSQLPMLQFLAEQFAVCDHWFSSMPGPTWPNRFFLHGASSSGFDDSPTQSQMEWWEVPGFGFEYPNGSIFQRLSDQGIPYRLYQDFTWDWLSAYSDDPQDGSRAGAVPQASSLKGVTMADFYSVQQLADDLQQPYPYPYTFIEPHYGDVTGGTYRGGSSQHPMDDTYGGEHLLGAIYAAISSSPYWESSLLIITYDEHGGFYDSVTPPNNGQSPPPTDKVVPPGDNPTYGYNTHGFDFTALGVRVPAMIVSPLVPPRVDQTVYDHSSVPRLLEDLWDLDPLTRRDAAANSPLAQVSLATPRALPPMPVLERPAAPADVAAPAGREAMLARPLPDSGNLIGAVANLYKADNEMAEITGLPPIKDGFGAIETRGDVEAYAAEVLARVRQVSEARDAADAVRQ